MLSAPLVLAPLVGLPAAQADTTKADLDTYEPMDALKGKDYGKPRMR